MNYQKQEQNHKNEYKTNSLKTSVFFPTCIHLESRYSTGMPLPSSSRYRRLLFINSQPIGDYY